MKWSKTLIPTMKETPDGAEIPSHILMLRAGLISQVMAGAYSYLPLGLRSLQKAIGIVREEMNAAGCIEVFLTAMCPISLYEQTHRVEAFGDVLVKAVLPRAGKKVPIAFCPTHEEEITDLVAHYISSYRQLPITLYQIQTKFRNEERPKFGILRTSEFMMKDAYSFHTNLESLNETYKVMYAAYCRIFKRCGLHYLPVEAESGPIGGDASHEFMIPSPNGEDKVVCCPVCHYAANTEKAEIGGTGPEAPDDSVPRKPLTLKETPNVHTIDHVCTFFKAKQQQVVKTLIYSIDGVPVAVLVRGDHDVNENKLKRALQADSVELANEETIEKVTGAPVGFAGPVGLKEKIRIVADYTIRGMVNYIVGANQPEKHYLNANMVRDFDVDLFADLRNAEAGDPCPHCMEKMTIRNAIEVGHVFKLGTKYSEALNAKFADVDETLKTVIMGCYGIGVNRIVAGIVETSYDDHGIIWPMALAPYEVCISPVKVDEESMAVANRLHDELTAQGIEVLLDDRDQRAGVKFKDADLIGFPLRITIGTKGLTEGKLELKWRWNTDSEMIALEGAVEQITALVQEERKTGARFTASKKV